MVTSTREPSRQARKRGWILEEGPRGLTDLVAGNEGQRRIKGSCQVFEMSCWVDGGAMY